MTVKDRQIRFQIDQQEEEALTALARREGVRSASMYCALLARRKLAEEAATDAA